MKKIALVLPALAAGIMMAAVGNASAQVPPPPQLPDIPTGEGPTVPDMPDDTAKPATRVTGTTARWSRSTRTLSVRVSCGRSGAVTVLRHGNRIGRKTFTCNASRAATVRVRITRAANRNLRVGATVTARVNAGSAHHSKRLRVVRATASNARVASLATSAADFLGCSNWYGQNKYAGVWPTAGAWWEFYCAYEGLVVSSGIGFRYDYFFWNGNNQQYYGSWNFHAQDSCWYWWDVYNGAHYGPWGC